MAIHLDNTSNKHCRRGAVFGLRLLLSHPEMLGSFMEDNEPLLRLLGKNVVWDNSIAETIYQALQSNDDEIDPDELPSDPRLAFLSLLKGRHAWGTYERTLCRLYIQEPQLILAAFAENLRQLKPAQVLKAPGNHNVKLLTTLLGLNRTETRLLDFSELRSYQQFRGFLRNICGFAPADAYALVASAIDCPVREVRQALRADAPLRAYGLIHLDTSPSDLEDFLRLDDTGQNFMAEEFATPEEMLHVVLHPSLKPHLAVSDYPHLQREFTWLSQYLRNVTTQRVKGANILFYGAPGTGKSELARLLAQEVGLTAFDVQSADSDGDPITGKTRLNHFALSQRFLAEREAAMVIFDEIEDVFPDHGFAALFGGKNNGKGEQSKAWLNQQLEHSPIPAIWISNSLDSIDPAFLRRFAFHVEFRTPPKTVRERVVRRCLADRPVSQGTVQRLAADDQLSPAQISQAGRFASLCQSHDEGFDEAALLEAVRASQQAMGRPVVGRRWQDNSPCNFAWLNLDSEFPLEKIEQSLRRLGRATLCFYGVPGAGKTSLAHHFAEAVGRPLLVKRASDLLGMYVGQSEKNIAQMFREAAQDGAVLLLDEADSFLRSRQQAHHSWEVTQVNELLQQMENFDGIFICTTNLMDDVDEAALRRFTFKLRFQALNNAQRESLFAEMVLGNADLPLPSFLRHDLHRLNNLTPGDFANVRQQEQLLGEAYSPEEFLKRLERECHMKRSGSKAIGFVHNT